MKAINRLVEATNFKKYRKYIERELLSVIERYLGFKLSPVIGSDTSYGCSYKAITTVDDKYFNVVVTFTTNDIFLKGDKVMVVDLIINGKSFPTYISCKNVQDDIDALYSAFDSASRYFDADFSLDDLKFDEE